MHLDLISAVYKEGKIILQIEWSNAHQSDGHGPAHGDLKRDFAENILRNIPREKLIAVLRENNISSIKTVKGYTIKNRPSTNVDHLGMKLKLMEIIIGFEPSADNNEGAAEQLINGVKWFDMKHAIDYGEVNSYKITKLSPGDVAVYKIAQEINNWLNEKGKKVFEYQTFLDRIGDITTVVRKAVKDADEVIETNRDRM